MKHRDHPDAADFRFTEDRHTAAFVCQHVADGAAILEAAHDADGDWQFLCGGDHGEDELPVVWCLEHVAAQDPSVNELADIPIDHSAFRDDDATAWTVTEGVS